MTKMNSIKEKMSSRISDPDVIHRILNGENQFYEILLKRYNQRLYRVIRGYLKDADVEDVMQETYIKAFNNLNQFIGKDAAFSSWLIRIGINEALQYIRKNKKYRLLCIQEDNGIANVLLNLADTHHMNPEKQLINKEGRVFIETAIDQLAEKYRIVYILREIEGMKNSEIATCLNISETNAKVRFHRAKELMKERLLKLSSDFSVLEFGNSRCNRVTNQVMIAITNQ